MDLTTVGRQALLFLHLMVFAYAISAILKADLEVLFGKQIAAAGLVTDTKAITVALGFLWLTGLGLIALDVGFDWAALVSKPKLATKLTVVILLTLNGIALHRIAFPMLSTPQASPTRSATVCAVLGAFSSVTWIYAAFVGSARLIAPWTNYGLFMGLYVASLLVGVVVALVVVRPKILQTMVRHTPPADLAAGEAMASDIRGYMAP
jgi:hypothetical protein